MDIDLIKNHIRCRNCLEMFESPRRLECNHHFCQRCLEDLLIFEDDGSARILCPLNCSIETRLGPTDTVDKLPISHEFKGLLEALRPERDQICKSPKCLCGEGISMYCCGHFMCLSCYSNDHSRQDVHKNTFKVIFNRNTSEFEILCEEHSTGCSYFFFSDFFCLYCMNRTWKQHKGIRDTINVKANFVKNDILNKQKEIGNVLEQIPPFKKITESYVEILERKLGRYLDDREDKCLDLYKDHLMEKKLQFIGKFRLLTSKHLEQYSSINDYVKFLEDTSKESDMKLCIEERNIWDATKKGKGGVNSERISITLSEFLSDFPLGDVNISKEKQIVWDSIPSSTIVCEDKDIAKIEIKENPTKGLSDLMNNYEENVYQINCKTRECEEKLAMLKGDLKIVKDGNIMSISQYMQKHTEVLPQVFLEISVDGSGIGKLIIDLFSNDVPRTCENFIHLCLGTFGFGYQNSEIHYYSRNFCAGGRLAPNTRLGGKSIYGPSFEVENFVRKHDSKGIVSMRSCNSAVDSVFYFTTKAMPVWNNNSVAFGKVTDETFYVLEQISSLGLATRVVICDCGVVG